MARVVPDFNDIIRYVDELEDGIYRAKINANRAKELHEDDNGTYFNLDFQLLDGPEDGSYIGARIHTNGRFAFQSDQLMKALDLKAPFDTQADLQGKTVRIQTVMNESNGKFFVNIRRILPDETEGPLFS